MGRETEEVRRFRVVEAEELLNWAKKDMGVVRGRFVRERAAGQGGDIIDWRWRSL